MMNDELRMMNDEVGSSAAIWDSSTSLRSVFNSRYAAFKRCCAAFKSIIFHRLISWMRLSQSINEYCN